MEAYYPWSDEAYAEKGIVDTDYRDSTYGISRKLGKKYNRVIDRENEVNANKELIRAVLKELREWHPVTCSNKELQEATGYSESQITSAITTLTGYSTIYADYPNAKKTTFGLLDPWKKIPAFDEE